MAKKLLSLTIAMVMIGSITVMAQTCTPDAQYTATGVYPDTLVGLPCAQETVLYQTTITVIAPVDSLYDLGFPIGTINATIDSIVIQDNTGDAVAVNGLPPGFTFVCNPPSCSFPGGSTGCILLIGTPGSGDAGTYDIAVEVDAYVLELEPLSANPINMDKVDQYSIVISASAPPVGSATVTDATMAAPSCDGSATASGGITYQWDNDAGAVTTAMASNLCEGTYNVGVYDVNGCGSVVTVSVGGPTGVATLVDEISATTNVPNPFSDKTGISFKLKENGMVNLIVFDIVGKIIHSESFEGVTGNNVVEFDAEGLVPGVYMYNLVSGGYSVSGKMTVAK